MDMEKAISAILRTGLVLCVILLAIGSMLLFAKGGGGGISLGQITAANSAVNSSKFSIDQIIAGLFRLDGISFILLGLIVLMATPIARVLISIFAFLYEENWLYFVITAIVFINLMVAIFIVPLILVH